MAKCAAGKGLTIMDYKCWGLKSFGYKNEGPCPDMAAAQFAVWPMAIPRSWTYAMLCQSCLRRLCDDQHHGREGIEQVNRIDPATGRTKGIPLGEALGD